MPLVELSWDGTQWRGGGATAPSTDVTQASRNALVYGTYKPNSSTYSGVIPGITLDPVFPPSNDPNRIRLPSTPTTYTNKIFWGKVYGKGASTFYNCLFAGADPNSDVFTTLSGNFSNIASGGVTQSFQKFYDCSFDSGVWTYDYPTRPLPLGTAREINPNGNGFHGGNMAMYRCEITNVQDGVNYVATTGTSCLIESSWIHKMYYKDNWYGPSDGHTHSDAFQFNYAKDIVVRNSVLGGIRQPSTYYNIGDAGWGQGYNSGDDALNACFMIKQEGTDAAPDKKIERVTIENNWLYGGTFMINIFYVAARPTTFNDMIIRNNKFGQRGTGWGGGYLTKSPQIQAQLSNNTIEETGAAIPITTGGSG